MGSNHQPVESESTVLPVELHACGGDGWNRTTDAQLFRLPLYQLSYIPVLLRKLPVPM